MKKSKLLQLLQGLSISKSQIIFASILSISSAAILLYMPLQAKQLIDNFETKFNLPNILALGATLIIQAVLSAISYYLLTRLAERTVKQIREKVSNHLLNVKQEELEENLSGDLASSVVTNTETISRLLSGLLPNVISGLTSVIGALFFLCIMSWQLTLVVLGALIFLMIVISPISNITNKTYEASQAKTNGLVGQLTNYFSEIELLKSSNAQHEIAGKIKQEVTSLYLFGIRIAKINSIMDPLVTTVIMTTILIIFGFGGYLVSVKTITIGTLISFLLFVFQIITPFANVGNVINDFQASNGAAKHLIDLLSLEEENYSGKINFSLKNASINFQNVNFSYHTTEEALKNLDLTFKNNQLTALVGPSGGGKSTIISLLERFYEPTSGKILINNYNINKLNLKIWRSKIGYVPQQTSVIGKTLRESLLFGLNDHQISDAEIQDTLNQAYLSNFVNRLPKGLDTPIEEHSANLSGGQVQRLMLARALLRKPELLILDEFTSALDSDSEKFIKQSINDLRNQMGIVVVAHRLSTIKDADQIYFIKNGTVAGLGTHEELIKCLPLYRKYVEEQQL
ncbi:ABC transporter ATP-binding protein [Pediococcus ethanolidurans]|uniref:ABC transporter ATP-binding protein n=1 Tax=Pediococcus ethanolidurans TaxID=319653 RepID=UPI001C1EE1F7|nr:ABC transporter ATP-binding protein [Pediococcus ethanolidurans]MBU7555413.1 ABC transporter ATP-binding protein [Pediococcus ethanolidurans]MBU7564178.1 ABC transporter ATP-binding protein [Pediococcus ethanolidurans]MCT4398401.1 ABC transporter ATP-binding protein [Pediococcus ethanolidurans]MCV3316204.1 ABC transporter ATP-binding protein/permease [Pediococcus ethanolidurans]MCV3322445.1 ABC transporter ATP-binding protein/permease [Pediococcus ethanolidurans]